LARELRVLNSKPRQPKPEWLRIRLGDPTNQNHLLKLIEGLNLHTVCQEAKCPNIFECWANRTATFMLGGDICTRHCGFCAVGKGEPGVLDSEEPRHVAEAVQHLNLAHTVITSVNRDDLPDGGAKHYADCIRAIKALCPATAVEALTPDFCGKLNDVATVVDSGLDVFAQNLETVRRLTHRVRDVRAGYEQTLDVLAFAKRHRPEVLTKSSLMLGLGETGDEIAATLDDLKRAGVDIVTFGQYLRPTANHLPVERYVPPVEFEQYRKWGLARGFLEVVAGPLVRSSYRADRVFEKNNVGLNRE